jgi:phage baseplate assembly protein W
LKIILSWPLGTKQFNHLFGSRVNELLESPNDAVLMALVRKFVIDSVTTWEKRIDLLSVNIAKQDNDKLVVDLIYKVKALNVQDSYSYTYYTN